MKCHLLSHRLCSVVLVAITIGLLATSPLSAAGRKKSPASKLFVADVEGVANIDTGETIQNLTKQSVYTAQGTIIQTKEDSTNAMVFSNGTGVYFSPDTRLEVQKFVQEPFTPNRTDMEVEPSISTTKNFLARGSVGICTSKMVAGSSMRYNTPHASITVKGRKAVVESTNEGTTVSMLEGEATVQAGENDAGGYTVKPGQQAFVPSNGGPVQIKPITNQQMAALDDKVTMACMARKTVYFEVKNKNGGAGGITAFDGDEADQEIVAFPTTPPNIDIKFTVSAANLRK